MLCFQIFNASLCLALFFSHSALASRIEVVNNTKQPIKVQIKAENHDLKGEAIAHNQEIPGECYFSFWVVAPQLKGKPLYSIKGYTSPFTPGGKCDRLNVEKNYKVIFNGDDALGIRCIAEVIQ
jgi:hypothetical protein